MKRSLKDSAVSGYNGLFGQGWAFPPAFDTLIGAKMALDAEDIHQSMQILFSTALSERIMREDYGCDLQPMAFATINDDLIAKIDATITDAVLRHEQRVVLVSVDVEQDTVQPALLRLLVVYRIRGTDQVMRLVGQLDIGDGRRGVFV